MGRHGILPGNMPAAPSSYGVKLKSLVACLIIYQHVPVQRCVQLIGDQTGGTTPSAGFVHGMLARCAAVLDEVAALIKTAVRTAAVAGSMRPPPRCGPAGQKNRSCPAPPRPPSPSTWAAGTWARLPRSGYPGFAGLAVYDCYACYYNPACLARLARL